MLDERQEMPKFRVNKYRTAPSPRGIIHGDLVGGTVGKSSLFFWRAWGEKL